jgi:hypothetical protein
MSIPDTADGTGRFSLDHLFLDQEGIPTFVECKRASDTRGRREVVAQMLDYAANGVQYWPMDRLRQAATETAIREGVELNDKVQGLLRPDEAPDETAVETYWQRVEKNLRAGNVRLIFVADEIPKELRRLVEFLNEKMPDVEVMAIEVKQFRGTDDQTVLVPRVIGLTEAARVAKETARPGPKKRIITREEFLANCAPNLRAFFKQVLDRTGHKGHIISWGTVGFSARVKLPSTGQLASFVYGYPYNTVADFDFYFAQLPFTDEEAQTFRQKLLASGFFKESGQKTLRASLKDEQHLTSLHQIYELILQRIDELVQKQSQPNLASQNFSEND